MGAHKVSDLLQHSEEYKEELKAFRPYYLPLGTRGYRSS